MANNPDNAPLNSSFDPAKLDRVQNLLEGLKQDARRAHVENDLFMLSVYNALLAVASPIVVKAHARVEREAKAAANKAEKELRRAERARKKAEQEAEKHQASDE